VSFVVGLPKMFPQWSNHFLPEIKNSGQVKKIPGKLFHLHVEEVYFLAMEAHRPKSHPWDENTTKSIKLNII